MAAQQQFATYRAAGEEITEEWPSLQWAQAQLDELLDAEPEIDPVDTWSLEDRELLQLMGVRA